MADKFVKIFKNGLMTGLFLQLAVGPVFFFIINLALQRTIADGLIAALAVTIVDYFYITIAILGIGKLIEKKKNKKIFGLVSSVVLIIFGFIIINGIITQGFTTNVDINSTNLFSSFVLVFILTISSPMTIVFFTGLFTAKAVEYNYTKKELWIFGLAVGSATLIFMSLSVLMFSLLKGFMPLILIQSLNLLVGIVLIGYGLFRIIKIFQKKPKKK
tara:strand:- start:4556 stop:5203 length:648 start_codon:yes stop_codon:yes gene_type:complete